MNVKQCTIICQIKIKTGWGKHRFFLDLNVKSFCCTVEIGVELKHRSDQGQLCQSRKAPSVQQKGHNDICFSQDWDGDLEDSEDISQDMD